MTKQHHYSLIEAPVGSNLRIHHLGSHPEVSSRLRELGFCENTTLRCITKANGSIICEILNTRVGLNEEVAAGILVSPK